MSGSCCSACDWLCGNDERTVFATPGAYQPLLPGHRDTKAVYAAGKQQQRGEFGRQGSADQDTRQQVYFIGLFLIGGIASTFANNLEAVYIGHIRTCADSVALRCLHANCSAAAPYTPANATNVSCPVLVHELQLPCEGRLPQWALLPPESDAASGEVSGHGLLADACPLSCAQCKSSFANRDAPAQLAAYSLVESFLGWFGGLGGLWGGLTPMVGRCVGRGDEEGAGRLLKMSFACCLFSTAVAWTIVYPFGGLIVQGAFAPQQDVYHYAIPFMHVHAAGMFFQYLSVPHSYCDIIIQNLNEYVTASSAWVPLDKMADYFTCHSMRHGYIHMHFPYAFT